MIVVFMILSHCSVKASGDLHIKAQDFLTFGIKDKTCHAQGDVCVQHNATSLQSDNAFVQFQQKDAQHRIQFLRANGHIRIGIPEGIVTGHHAFYHADQKKMTIKDTVRFDGLNATLWSDRLNLLFANTPEERPSRPWTLQSISSPHALYFQNNDIAAKGKKGTYNHQQKKAIVNGNVNIWHKKNYIIAEKAIVDLEKKCYFVGGNRVQSLIFIQENDTGNRKKNGPCGKKSS
jgi:lipopolysaccharide assembly outer membrane protein LptD (OstA)